MSVDVNELRSLVTVVSLGVFVAICAWAWSARNRQRFEEAALLPFAALAEEESRHE